MANLSSKTFETAIRVVTLLILVAILAQLVAVYRKLNTIDRSIPNEYYLAEAFLESIKKPIPVSITGVDNRIIAKAFHKSNMEPIPVSITDVADRITMPITGEVEITNTWEFGK